MPVARVSKFLAFSLAAIATLAFSATTVEHSGNLADGTGAGQVAQTATATPGPGAAPNGDVTWGG
ncbi:hypothetical protein ACFYS8_14615 [Kitasatospora sp. NPDC004615]|uniref:hypothetical protein n=1 Tax=Kitasatospora sp. NPDC004615 TaxID=3364017 RepID=UPI003698CC9F